MQLRTRKPLFHVVLSVFLLASLSACGLWQKTGRSDLAETAETYAEISTNIPFSTKEPEIFQAEIVVTSFFNQQKSEQRYFIARKGKSSLRTFYRGSENERSVLRTAENRTYLINHQTKNYRELSSGQASAFSVDKLIKSLTSKWLNEKTSAKFENLGKEKELTKYRVKLGDSINSEVFIYVDEKIKLPVKQEFFSLGDNKKNLTYQMEIKNFKPETGGKLFALPEGYEQLSVNGEQ